MRGGEQGSPRLPPHEVLFAEVCGQHIKELHIRRWLSQRPASDLIQQGMIRLTPARPHQRPQIAFHAAAGGFKMLSGLLVEALGDQQNMVGLLLHPSKKTFSRGIIDAASAIWARDATL